MKKRTGKGGKSSFIHFIILLVVCIQYIQVGCLETEYHFNNGHPEPLTHSSIDETLILPSWVEGQYHDYAQTTQLIDMFNRDYPDLVEIFSIGKSVQHREIWCIQITNEKNDSQKKSCVIDGCIHGNEWESAELCLYLAEYLVINFGTNTSVSNILNTSVIYLIPLLNPDGREKNDRFNGNGIDLNRNFDVHFGRFRGGSIPLGSPKRLSISYLRFPLLNTLFPNFFPSYVTNCGREPFSEPETIAFKNFLDTLDKEYFSFYVNGHTAMHFICPAYNILYKPDFSISEYEKDVMNTALYWCKSHTEYDIIKSDDYAFYGAGYANHWVFKEYHVPSFLFEMYSDKLEPGISGGGPHEELVYWMKESLPVLLFLLTNIDHLHNWDFPEIEPFLPPGIPPSQNS